MFLDNIIASTKKRVEKVKGKISAAELMHYLDHNEFQKGCFADALTDFKDLSIIAEIKKASPSKGLIRPNFDHMEIAREYAKSNIQAISVLTEPEYFQGDLQFVRDIKNEIEIPVLRKDFIVDEYQIYEAKANQADAILLIMAALSDRQYQEYQKLAKQLGLDVLTETHTEDEVKRAAEYGGIIGINNRDLRTFKEDITVCERLLPFVPKGKITVAESAIRTHDDFVYLSSLQFDAALIGEAFMREESVSKAVEQLRYGD